MGPAMRKGLYSVTAFVCLSYVVILWGGTFFCGKDVSVQWSQQEGACSVFYALEPFIINFALDLTCYFASWSLFLPKSRLPLQILSSVHLVCTLSLILILKGLIRYSTVVGVTLALGALTIMVIIVRFITLKIGTGQENLVCQ
jgi:hypothetical protein